MLIPTSKALIVEPSKIRKRKLNTKICKVCNQEKDIEEFYLYTKHGTNLQYRKSYCKKCRRKVRLEWDIKSKYKLSLDEYSKMMMQQNSRCAICEKEFDKLLISRNAPMVDHCHTTGKVRGLLCNTCNLGIAHFNDDPKLFLKAFSYLSLAADCPEGGSSN